MNHGRITTGIAALTGAALLLIPLNATAQSPAGPLRACPGHTLDASCLVAARGIGVELTFDKTAVDPSKPGVWTGTVAGDIVGTLETRLTERRVSGPIWHVRFEWIITAGDRSFVADLAGTLNTDTGAVAMHGTVVDGFLVGARVHEEGQLVDAATLRFQGTIRLVPATAISRRSR